MLAFLLWRSAGRRFAGCPQVPDKYQVGRLATVDATSSEGALCYGGGT